MFLEEKIAALEQRLARVEQALTRPAPATPIEIIQRHVTDHYGISMEHLLGSVRTEPLATRRQLAMYLSRRLTKESLCTIGRAFRRDHGTICGAVHKIQNRIDTEPHTYGGEVAGLIAILTRELPR